MVTKDEAKATEQLQNDYELVFIVRPEVADDALDPVINNITQFITGKGGTVAEVNHWGRKKMAYPINHFHYGYYNLVEFDLSGDKLQEVEKALRLSQDILRHQIVVKKKRSEDEIQKEKEKEKERVIKEKEKVKEETEKETKPKEEKRKTSKAKVDLNDLDEKLDKILDTNDLL